MSEHTRYFYRCDDGEKVNEVVSDENDAVGYSACVLLSQHFACVEFDVCLLSEGMCLRISTLHSF